jgi:hypothetical protein
MGIALLNPSYGCVAWRLVFVRGFDGDVDIGALRASPPYGILVLKQCVPAKRDIGVQLKPVSQTGQSAED